MPEELRIVVVDQGGAAPSRGAAAPAASSSARAPVASRAFPRLHAPPVQPPQFAGPPPVQPSPRAPATRDSSRGAISAVGTVGGIAGAAAAGNVAGAASASSAGIVAAVGGPIGVAVAAVAAGLGVAAIAARKFAQVVESQTNKLAGFSAPLSAAQAQTDVRRELALLRRAQRIGPELAAAERLRSKFEDAITDLGTEVLGLLLKVLEIGEPFIEVATKSMAILADFLEKHGDTIALAMKVLVRMNPIVLIMEAVFRILEKIFDTIVPDDPDPPDPFATAFMNLLPRNARGQREFFQPAPGV